MSGGVEKEIYQLDRTRYYNYQQAMVVPPTSTNKIINYRQLQQKLRRVHTHYVSTTQMMVTFDCTALLIAMIDSGCSFELFDKSCGNKN